ncbi:hypothetical protein [Paenibacillus harenae]|uniref:hypothetical protein n=1 Tax=Paenibacillus harenae TaxID=306543 RepID=UPI00048B996A|nr:hypothetical protein [Paenibacillus harenae]
MLKRFPPSFHQYYTIDWGISVVSHFWEQKIATRAYLGEPWLGKSTIPHRVMLRLFGEVT